MDQDVSWWTACSLRLEHVQKNEKACSLGMYHSVAWWKARSLTLVHVVKKEKFRHSAWTVFSANLFKLVRAVSRWKAGSWTWWVCESSLTYSLRTSCRKHSLKFLPRYFQIFSRWVLYNMLCCYNSMCWEVITIHKYFYDKALIISKLWSVTSISQFLAHHVLNNSGIKIFLIRD